MRLSFPLCLVLMALWATPVPAKPSAPPLPPPSKPDRMTGEAARAPAVSAPARDRTPSRDVAPVQDRSPAARGALSGDTTSRVQPPRMGFSVEVPGGWRFRQVNDHTTVLSGPENTPDWLTTLTLTNQQNPDPSSPVNGARAMMTDYISALKNRGSAWEVLLEASLQTAAAGPVTDGVQAVVRFQGSSGPIRQWVMILPRTDIGVAHLLIYTAPDDLFDHNLDRIRATIESLVFLPSSR